MSKDCALETVGKVWSCCSAACCAAEDIGVDAKLGAPDMSAHGKVLQNTAESKSDILKMRTRLLGITYQLIPLSVPAATAGPIIDRRVECNPWVVAMIILPLGFGKARTSLRLGHPRLEVAGVLAAERCRAPLGALALARRHDAPAEGHPWHETQNPPLSSPWRPSLCLLPSPICRGAATHT